MTAGSIAVPTIIPLRIPVGPKHVIDTSTKIELTSDTVDTVVFYTLDGTRPQPAIRSGAKPHRASNTFTYRTPFFLGAGKATIKAIACSKDLFKESYVVTRTFTVLEAGPQDSNDESEEESIQVPESTSPSQPRSLSAQLRHRLDNTSLTGIFSGTDTIPHCDMGSSENLPTNLAQSKSMLFSGYSQPPGNASIRSLGQVITKSGQASMKSTDQAGVKPGEGKFSRPITRDIPKPICLFCNSLRSKDPAHKFCTHCGCQLPPLSDTEPAPPLQVSLCPRCRAHLPVGSSACLVCEHPLNDPLPIPVIHAQARNDDIITCKEKVVCLACGTRNPRGATTCLTCEILLSPDPPRHPVPPSSPPAPLPNPSVLRPVSGSSYMMCGRCGRVNVSDARFCDWCGSKPQASQLSVQCSSCSVTNEWHYKHCFNCGKIIKAPLRPEVELSSTMKMPAHVEVDKDAWIPVVEIADRGPKLRTFGTQTQGIFFPSSRTIGNQKGSEFIKKVMYLGTQDRRPKLQSYSPGKGLWRVQVEHVVTHLKAHSQTSTEFQSAIGSPQLGKLLSAEVSEGEDRVDIQLSFAVKQQDQSSTQPKSLHMTRSSGSISNLGSTESLPGTSQQRRKTKTKNTKPPIKRSLTAETIKLIEEVSPSGQGRKDVIKALIENGADVTACSPDKGLPVLSLAASSNQVNCITLLVESGAKLNAQTRATGNTALHEAVMKGPTSIPSIEALLGHGANPKLRNSSGLTPCDVALKLKYDEIVTCFATYVGAGLLDSLCKHQPSLSLTL